MPNNNIIGECFAFAFVCLFVGVFVCLFVCLFVCFFECPDAFLGKRAFKMVEKPSGGQIRFGI